MSDNGHDDDERGMTHDQFLLHTMGQSAVDRIESLLHIEFRFDVLAQNVPDDKDDADHHERLDFGATVAVKAALIGLQTSLPELYEQAVASIQKQMGAESLIEVAGSVPAVDLSKIHAANPERSFTECHAMIPTLGLKIAPGLAQVTCQDCIDQIKLKHH